MATEFELIEDRLVSGQGVLKIPADDDYRYFRIYIDVIRFPSINYLNFTYPNDRTVYARVNMMVKNYVYGEFLLRYEQVAFDYDPREKAGYLGPPLACSFQAVYDQLSVIATALGLPPGPPGTPIPFEAVKTGVDAYWFECRDETALQIRLYGVKDDIVCPEGQPTPKTPPPPPLPFPPVPPGDPIEVDPPYEDTPDFTDDFTDPFEGDEETTPGEQDIDPPAGADCQRVEVNARVTIPDGQGGQTVTDVSNVYFGPVTGVGYEPGANPGSRTWVVYSRGIGFTGCQEPGAYNTGELSNSTTGFVELISVIPF